MMNWQRKEMLKDDVMLIAGCSWKGSVVCSGDTITVEILNCKFLKYLDLQTCSHFVLLGCLTPKLFSQAIFFLMNVPFESFTKGYPEKKSALIWTLSKGGGGVYSKSKLFGRF